MKTQVEVLGWAEGRNRWGDSTSISHLIIVEASSGRSRAACGPRVLTSGQVERDVPDYCPNRCGRCNITAGRMLRESTNARRAS